MQKSKSVQKALKQLQRDVNGSYQLGFKHAIDDAIDRAIRKNKKDAVDHTTDLDRIAYNHGYKKGKAKVASHMKITFVTE